MLILVTDLDNSSCNFDTGDNSVARRDANLTKMRDVSLGPSSVEFRDVLR